MECVTLTYWYANFVLSNVSWILLYLVVYCWLSRIIIDLGSLAFETFLFSFLRLPVSVYFLSFYDFLLGMVCLVLMCVFCVVCAMLLSLYVSRFLWGCSPSLLLLPMCLVFPETRRIWLRIFLFILEKGMKYEDAEILYFLLTFYVWVVCGYFGLMK